MGRSVLGGKEASSELHTPALSAAGQLFQLCSRGLRGSKRELRGRVAWGSAGRREGQAAGWGHLTQGRPLASALRCGGLRSQGGPCRARPGWTGLGWQEGAAHRKARKPQARGPQRPKLLGPHSWAAGQAGLPLKKEEKGSERLPVVRGGSQVTGFPHLLSFEALDARVSLWGEKVDGLRLGM